MKEKIYLSGPLFSQAEIDWGSQIKEGISESLGDKVEVIWPHEIAYGSPEQIFQINTHALDQCNIMVAILDGPQVDDGTAWEMGFHFSRGRKIIGIRTDFRKAGETNSSKVNAMIERSCQEIVGSLDDLISALEEILEA
jgi:nucleoside 2-deoxyribosyltransferase